MALIKFDEIASFSLPGAFNSCLIPVENKERLKKALKYTEVLRYCKYTEMPHLKKRVLITNSSSGEVNICSTGGDGCICYLEYDRDHEKLQFTGMKQVKELSMVQAVSYSSMLHNDLGSGNYAVGFASAEFIIWNLITEAKVVQIPCELRDCFAYVKDEIIYIHRHWVPDCERKIYPQNLHLQFHGREMHSLCFISENTRIPSGKERGFFPNACWLATGCEDGTVRLTSHCFDGDEDDEDEENGEDLVDSDDVEAAADGDEAAT
ncbi:hypothetical protein POM88_041050 [Heracleum sosnowskyi]|uniref:Uncharacterized protein n=1 Tax=Heracleum sosnowskyi TaxID=360622 RepID=A0AAD8HFP9_9APIA|nr:hypothetical protein POM88_041050 [Heracleum sosnowskyi]